MSLTKLHQYNSDLNKIYELFAFCADEDISLDIESDKVHNGHTYIVKEFVNEREFMPFGVRLLDFKRNELTQTFYLQRFEFFKHFLN